MTTAGPSALTVATYERIVELERAGVSRQMAIARVAESEGAKESAISARYYSARKAVAPSSTSAPARANGKVVGRSLDEKSVADLLDGAAAMLALASSELVALADDAQKWRDLQAMIAR